MKAFVAALLGTVALMLQLPTSGAQSSLTLTSSVQFDVTLSPSLCPGSTVEFNCVAVMFNFGLDWERNGMQFQQYTATSDVNEITNPRQGLSVALNSVTVIVNPMTNVTFDSTVTAVVNEGISSGDVITCGSALVETTNLTANYIAIPPPPQPPNTLRIDSSSSSSNNSVRLTMNFDPSFSEENKVEKYCIRSQNQACPNDSCVTAGGSYTCDGLETGVEYNFTVRAINCRDQESSETEVITVTPQIPLRPSSCQAFAVYNQSRNSGALSGITTLWSRVEDPSNITNLIPQNVLFYNLSFISTGNTDTVMLPLSSYDELCAADDSCNFTISDERLTGSGANYRVQVVAGNIVGTGEPLNCDGQINRRNSVFSASTTAPSSTNSDTTIECRFSDSLPPSSNITRECELCYSTLVNSQTPSRCITRGTTDGDDSLVTFTIQLLNEGPYGPFFYQLTAIEDNVTLAVIQGQQYTGCDPLLLGSISSPEINTRCSSLISSSGGSTGGQSQVGVQGDNGIIFCYSSPGGGGSGALQGTVATAFCDDGYEREGAESVTCGPNGSWGDLPRCIRDDQRAIEALLGWQVALIVIGVLLWFLAVGLDIVGVVLLILLAREKFNASFRFWHGLFIFLLILTALLLVVCIALWIALGVTVSNGREVGDDAFINARAGLCIAAFLLSLSAVLSAVVALFLTILMPKVLSSKGSVEITHTEEIAKEIPPENNDKRYDTLPASPQEEILLETSSERKEDLTSNQAMVPVEISIVNNGEVTSDPSTQEEQHSITEHDGGDKMNGSREALLSEEEKQSKPIEDEAIRNLLHELQIEPLTVDTQAATVSEPGNKENTRGDEVAEAGQS